MSRRHDDVDEDELSFSFSGVVGMDTISLCSRQSGWLRGDADSFDFHSGKTPKIKNVSGNKRTQSIAPPLIERPNGSCRVTPLGFVILVLALILIIRIAASAKSPIQSSPYDFSTKEIKSESIINSLDPILYESAAESIEDKPLRVKGATTLSVTPTEETATNDDVESQGSDTRNLMALSKSSNKLRSKTPETINSGN